MALRKAFGAELALPHGNDLRYDLAGTVVRSAAGVVRSGLFPPVSATLLTPSATMAVNVAAFSGVAVRDAGPVFLANDGPDVVTPAAAPSSNSRLDVMWAKQDDASSFVLVPDADNLPKFGVLQGAASGSPVRNPTGIPAGALELGTILIPSTASNSGSAGVVITPTFLYTAMAGGTILFRNTTERGASTYTPGQSGFMLDTQTFVIYNGTTWITAGGDTGWITPTLLNSWAPFGAPFATPSYRLLNGIVEFQGSMKSGTLTNPLFAALPPGMRPLAQKRFNVNAGTGGANIDITSAGVVTVSQYTGTGGSTIVGLDQVSFPAEQ